MTNLIDPVEPDELALRGRFSETILKAFVGSDHTTVRVNREELEGKNNLTNVYNSLRSYARSHDMKVRVFQRGGEVYLEKTEEEVVSGAVDSQA